MAVWTSLENWELEDITEERKWEGREGRETKREGNDGREEVEKWETREVGLKGIEGIEKEGKLVGDWEIECESEDIVGRRRGRGRG